MDPGLLVSIILEMSTGKDVPIDRVNKVAEHLCSMVTDPKSGRVSIKIGETTIWCNPSPPEVAETRRDDCWETEVCPTDQVCTCIDGHAVAVGQVGH